MMTQMKKILFILFLIVTIQGYGQGITDHLLKARAMSSVDIDMALKVLDEALVSSNDYRIRLERAELNLRKGDYSASIADFTEANKIEPASGEYGLAKVYARKGDIQTALYHLDLNLGSQWKRSEKDIVLDPAFGSVENRTEWKSFWRKERYTDLERRVSEIEYYTSAGKIGNARELLAEIRVNYPATSAVIYSEALLSLASGKPADAVKFITRLTETTRGNEKYLRLLARSQEAASNPAGASVTYSRLLDSGVADADLLLARAACYRKTGENDKALADVEKFLSYYPDDNRAISLAGKTQAVGGDNLRALELFSRNIELNPNNPSLYLERGNAYLVSRSWDWAIKDYSMSLDLSPGNSDAWLNKGIALLNSGKKTDACHDFKRALSLGNKKAAEYINRNCIK
jgi:tetratricopeptide (TPR) repeat protein